MATAQSILAAERYVPRAAWFDGIVACGPADIKLSVISFDGKLPSDELTDAARRTIAACRDELADTAHLGAGFAILHRDDEANWLALHWWIAAGTVTHKLWRSELDGTQEFKPVDKLVTTCVWELGIVDFERTAWMDTAMTAGTVPDYLSRTFPRGTV